MEDVLDGEKKPVEVVTGTLLTGEPIFAKLQHFVQEEEEVDGPPQTRMVLDLDENGDAESASTCDPTS